MSNKLARRQIAEDTMATENGHGDEIVCDGWVTRRMRALGYIAVIIDDPNASDIDLHIAIRTKDHLEKLP